jgi:hypothetical protein
MKKPKKQHTILKSEGANQHTLYGDFAMETNHSDFAEISVRQETNLRHEQPDGSFGEHFGLKVEQGEWVMGRQIEYNPFKRTVSQVFD